jgi:hypothetical protein
MPPRSPAVPQQPDTLRPGADPRIAPHQALAAAVLQRARLDAGGGRWVAPEDVADARLFLSGQDGRLRAWTDLAGLPLEAVREGARRALAGGSDGRPMPGER